MCSTRPASRCWSRRTAQIYYELHADNLAGVRDNVTVPSSEMIHDMTTVRFHPLCGLPPMAPAALAATQGLDIQRQPINLFRNSGRPGGILAPDGQRISEGRRRTPQGAMGAELHRRSIPARSRCSPIHVKFQPMAQAAKDAQLVEQLGLSGKMVCSAFNVPAHMVGIGDPPSYNNIEALNQQYYSQCLQKYFEAIELCLDEGLGLTGVPGRSYGTEFDLDNLLRMDTATLVKTEAEAVRGGIKAPNESAQACSTSARSSRRRDAVPAASELLASPRWPSVTHRDDPFGTAAPQAGAAAANDDEDEDDEDENAVAFVEDLRRKSAERLNYA